MNHFIELLRFVSFAVFRSHFFSSDTVDSFTSVSPSVLLFEIFFFNSSKEFFISSSKPNARAISMQPSSALPLTVVLRKSHRKFIEPCKIRQFYLLDRWIWNSQHVLDLSKLFCILYQQNLVAMQMAFHCSVFPWRVVCPANQTVTILKLFLYIKWCSHCYAKITFVEIFFDKSMKSFW